MIFKFLGKWLDLILYILIALVLLDVLGVLSITQFFIDFLQGYFDFVVDLIKNIFTKAIGEVVG